MKLTRLKLVNSFCLLGMWDIKQDLETLASWIPLTFIEGCFCFSRMVSPLFLAHFLPPPPPKNISHGARLFSKFPGILLGQSHCCSRHRRGWRAGLIYKQQTSKVDINAKVWSRMGGQTCFLRGATGFEFNFITAISHQKAELWTYLTFSVSQS